MSTDLSIGIIISEIFVVIVFILIFIMFRKGNKRKEIDVKHVNEDSFQRFAKFFGETYPHEEKFDAKLNQIYTLIQRNGERDIKKIAELSSCAITECVIKIKYLKNKRLIDDLYIDTNNLKLIHCSKEDQELIDKYKPYIYGTHQQIGEFFNLIPWASGISGDEQKKKILEELKYLDENNLINGVKIDDVDGKLIYYTLEKRKTVYNQETVHCPNCGALNDVEITGKVRCAYCKSIVMGSAAKEEIEES